MCGLAYVEKFVVTLAGWSDGENPAARIGTDKSGTLSQSVGHKL